MNDSPLGDNHANGQWLKLIHEYLDGTCDPQQVALLERVIAKDDVISTMYIEACELHAALSWEFAPPMQISIDRPPARGGLGVSFGLGLRLAAAAAVLIATVSVILSLPFHGAGVRQDMVQVGAGDGVWSGAIGSEHEYLQFGQTYTLSQGRVLLRTPVGASCVMHAPASFTFIDEHRIELTEGLVTVRAETTEVGEFVVETPGAVVRDLGTEFLVRVDSPTTSSVLVREGVVEVFGRSSTGDARAAATLHAGEAAQAGVAGVSRVARFEADATWPVQLAIEESLPPSSPERRWLTDALGMINDPSLLLWLDVNVDRQGVNRGSMSRVEVEPLMDVPVSRLGRHAGAQAFDFREAGSGLIAEIPGEHRSITLAAWVRLDPSALPKGYIHRGIVIAERWAEPGYVHWQVKPTDFRLTFTHPEADPHAIYSATRHRLDDGAWHMLATVYDADIRSVSHYWNGRIIAREAIEGDPIGLSFGRVHLGSRMPTAQYPDGVAMGGWLDDLMIWSRALDSEEIGDLYQTNRDVPEE